MKKIVIFLSLYLVVACTAIGQGDERRINRPVWIDGYIFLQEMNELPADAPVNSIVNYNDTIWVKDPAEWSPLRSLVIDTSGTSKYITDSTIHVQFLPGNYFDLKLSPYSQDGYTYKWSDQIPGDSTSLLLNLSPRRILYALRKYNDGVLLSYSDFSVSHESGFFTYQLIDGEGNKQMHWSQGLSYWWSLPQQTYYYYGVNSWHHRLQDKYLIEQDTSTLKINRGLQLGYSHKSAAADSGTIRYNSGNVEVFNGSDWRSVSSDGGIQKYGYPFSGRVATWYDVNTLTYNDSNDELLQLYGKFIQLMSTSSLGIELYGNTKVMGILDVSDAIITHQYYDDDRTVYVLTRDSLIHADADLSVGKDFDNPTFKVEGDSVYWSKATYAPNQLLTMTSTKALKPYTMPQGVQIEVTSEQLTSGEESGYMFAIPEQLDDMNLIKMEAYPGEVNGDQTSLAVTCYRRRSGTEVSMTSTGASFSANAVINTSNDDVQRGDQLEFRWTFSGGSTLPTGLIVQLTFQKP